MKKFLFKIIDRFFGHKMDRLEGNASYVWSHCLRCGELGGPIKRVTFNKLFIEYMDAVKRKLYPPIYLWGGGKGK